MTGDQFFYGKHRVIKGQQRKYNNQMDMNERHRTLFQMSDGLNSANRLFALGYHSVPLVIHQGVNRRNMKIGLFLFAFLLISDTSLLAGELPKKLMDSLTGVIKSQCPEASIEIKDGVFFAKFETMMFTIHGSSKTGKISEKTYQQEGPNYKGFLLRVSLEEGGPFQGQAVVPQTVHQVYWETYIDRPPAKDGSGYYNVSFSYGSRIDKDLKQLIFSTIPRTERKLTPRPESSLPITEALRVAMEYIEKEKMDISKYYIDSIRLLQQSSWMQGQHWVITWQIKDTYVDGGEIIIIVGMNKEIRRTYGE